MALSTKRTQKSLDKELFEGFLCLLPSIVLMVIMPLIMGYTTMWMGGVAITLALFLIAQHLLRRSSRISGVISNYMRIYEEGGHINGLDTLFRAGVCGLKNRWEVDEVCREIEIRMRSKKTPNHNYMSDTLPNKVLLPFLKYCKDNQVDLKSSVATGIAAERFKQKLPFK